MKYLYMALSIIIAAIIFIFSSQSANVSKKSSMPIADVLNETLYHDSQVNKSPEEIEMQYKRTHSIVRKSAHMCLFLLLGLSTAMWFSFFKHKNKFLFAFLACVIYAILDETKQLFIPGRSCEFADMLIDSLGALLGMCIAILICKFKSKSKKTTL